MSGFKKITTPSEIAHLLSTLKKDFPISKAMWQVVRDTRDGLMVSNFFTDEWPNFTTVVSQEFSPRLSELADIRVHTNDKKKVMQILDGAKLLEKTGKWHAMQLVTETEDDVHEYLLEALTKHPATKGLVLTGYKLDIFQVPDDYRLFSVIPTGFNVTEKYLDLTNFIVTFEWGPPPESNGIETIAIYYRFSISPAPLNDPDTVELMITDLSWNVTLEYGTNYTANITAVNCLSKSSNVSTISIYSAFCDPPDPPVYGSLETIPSLIENGSILMFKCDVTSDAFSSTCSMLGEWEPSPDQHICTGPSSSGSIVLPVVLSVVIVVGLITMVILGLGAERYFAFKCKDSGIEDRLGSDFSVSAANLEEIGSFINNTSTEGGGDEGEESDSEEGSGSEDGEEGGTSDYEEGDYEEEGGDYEEEETRGDYVYEEEGTGGDYVYEEGTGGDYVYEEEGTGGGYAEEGARGYYEEEGGDWGYYEEEGGRRARATTYYENSNELLARGSLRIVTNYQ